MTDEDTEEGQEEDETHLVLTSLWEALFSLPWKESMWLIWERPARPRHFKYVHKKKSLNLKIERFHDFSVHYNLFPLVYEWHHKLL